MNKNSSALHNDVAIPSDSATLCRHYQQIRQFTEILCQPLAIEDYVIQSMPDVSPSKWHLAHTSWFFEAFILRNYDPHYQPLNDTYHYLFNSYYEGKGKRHCRPKRGLISRPTVDEIFQYRAFVDRQLLNYLADAPSETYAELERLVTLGLHHEQQHQELILTDIKHVFSVNPLRPAYNRSGPASRETSLPGLGWSSFPEGLYSIGHDEDDFSYDNETPKHRTYLGCFELASRLVTNGEYLAFIEDGGYARPEFWLSDGWSQIQNQQQSKPLYWEFLDEEWHEFTLAGLRQIDRNEPVCHINYFEADAYARWTGWRLPTEQEWEVAAAEETKQGNFVEQRRFHPNAISRASSNSSRLHQMFGDVWEWTASPYSPYPGYKPLSGALGEYNGKFMCNQFVLRGGSCATSRSHIRHTYRNFFPPDASWQFTGIRLARDVL